VGGVELLTTGRRILIVATSGGGGDLQPLLALAAGLRERGHQVVAFGDASVRTTMISLGVETIVQDGVALMARQDASTRVHRGY
jgi:UDP:flavonoid glycosyltransferase YjiC (YdhE family)